VIELLQAACAGGNSDAQYKLAGMYEAGAGVTRDAKQAFKLYDRRRARLGPVGLVGPVDPQARRPNGRSLEPWRPRAGTRRACSGFALRCAALCTALCTALQSALRCAALCTALCSLHCAALRCTALCSLRCAALHCAALPSACPREEAAAPHAALVRRIALDRMASHGIAATSPLRQVRMCARK
jgi:hypothetical protein